MTSGNRSIGEWVTKPCPGRVRPVIDPAGQGIPPKQPLREPLDGNLRGVVYRRDLEIRAVAKAGAAGQRIIGRGTAGARVEIMLATVGRSGEQFPASLPTDQHEGQNHDPDERGENQQDGLEHLDTPALRGPVLNR